jgi:putative transposase
VDLDVQVGPEHVAPEDALVVLARRHAAYGYRRLWAKLRRAGYVVNRKRVQLRLWGYGLTRPRPHPKAQGRPFDVSAPNQLWQTDTTAIWCGEDGWRNLTSVLDCFDRSMVGLSMTARCRARDSLPAMEMAGSTPGPTARRRRPLWCSATTTARGSGRRRRGTRHSRTHYRHPDGNAPVERISLSLKREEVWPQDFASFAEAQAAVTPWILDYNTERSHQSLEYRTPAEVRQEALGSTQSAA